MNINNNYVSPNFNATLKIDKQFMNPERAFKLEQQFAEKTKNIKDIVVRFGENLNNGEKGFVFDIYNENLGIQRYGKLKENAKEIFKNLKDSDIIKACKKLAQLTKKEDLQEEYLLKKCDEISSKLDLDAYDGISVIMKEMQKNSSCQRSNAIKQNPIFDAFNEIV